MLLVKLSVMLMASLVLMGAPDMSRQTAEPKTDIPEANVIVTPATRDEPLPKAEPQQQQQPQEQPSEPRSISYLDVEYSFPADTTDDEMFEFLNQIPAVEAKEEEPPEPLRETKAIKRYEGTRKNKDGEHISYKDKNVLSGGIGHQLTKEEKKLYPKGTAIPDDVVEAWFKADMIKADNDITELLEQHRIRVPDEVYDVLLNMTFNMGQGGVKKFKKMWLALEIPDFKEAARQMLINTAETGKSQYLKDVGNRALQLSARMAAVSNAEQEQTEK